MLRLCSTHEVGACEQNYDKYLVNASGIQSSQKVTDDGYTETGRELITASAAEFDR